MRVKHFFLSCLLGLVVPAMLFPHLTSAQGQYQIREMTDELKTALENRRQRYEALKAMKGRGLIGENNRGYLDVLSDQEGAQRLTSEENRDRRTIYEAIAEQNDLTQASGTIEKVFAQVQRDKAETGEMIQMENGQWTKK
jgi:uncharacterized protein YdbL (DUF1318 family)